MMKSEYLNAFRSVSADLRRLALHYPEQEGGQIAVGSKHGLVCSVHGWHVVMVSYRMFFDRPEFELVEYELRDLSL
jgi:hypothetical protein